MPHNTDKVRRPDGGATDQVGIGPTDIDGAAASELPDGGRGTVDPRKELGRRLPGQTGGIVGDATDTGLAGDPDVADARDHGGRKHN